MWNPLSPWNTEYHSHVTKKIATMLVLLRAHSTFVMSSWPCAFRYEANVTVGLQYFADQNVMKNAAERMSRVLWSLRLVHLWWESLESSLELVEIMDNMTLVHLCIGYVRQSSLQKLLEVQVTFDKTDNPVTTFWACKQSNRRRMLGRLLICQLYGDISS